MEDYDIIELYWARDQEAIRQTDRKYGGFCRSILRRILGDGRDAEECLNDTWLGAWNAMPVHRPERLAPFLGKITRSLAFNRYQARQAEKRGGGQLPLALEELGDCVPAAPSAAQAAEDRELERAVDRVLHSQPSRDCDIFLRRYWYVEPVADIGERYGLKASTVKSSLYRSREKLRRFLEKEGITL